MRAVRLIAFAVAGAVLAGGAIAFATPLFMQTFDVRYSARTPKTSAGFEISLSSSDAGAPSGKPTKAMRELRVTFPAGTSVSTTGVYGQCKASLSQLGSAGGAACPGNSRLGVGRYVANAAPLARQQGQITAFNAKNGMSFVLDAAGQSLAFAGTWRGTTLTVRLPAIVRQGVTVVLTDLRLVVRRKSVGTGSTRKHYLRTPATCKSTWTTRGRVTFDDGSVFTKTRSQSCRT